MWALRRLYLIVTLTGAVIMALEILSSRVLAPHYGNSVYVWGSIISVFLAALSVGYYWGGRLADRRPELAVLGRLILAGALFQTLLLFGGIPLAAWLSRATGVSPLGTLATTTVLFGPPSVFLATVSPFAIRLAARDLAHLGDTAGRLFAVSTAGSLVGTLAATFLLIPYLPLRPILALLLLATAAAVTLTVRRSQTGRPFTIFGVVALAGIATFGLLDRQEVSGSLLYRRMTPYQTLEVSESEGVRWLRSDGFQHSAIRVDNREPALIYLRYAPAALLLAPELERMLVLGMGGGAVGTYLRSRIPELGVDYVDVDAAVPEIARRFLYFEESPGLETHVGDARRFLAATNRQWDYIYCDTYIGLSVPFHLTTRQFFDLVSQRLAPGGVVGVNLAASLRDPFARAIVRTVSERFPTVYVFAVRGSGNTLVLASPQTDTISRDRMIERAEALDRRWAFTPSLATMAAQRFDAEIDTREALLLTDDYAPADHLIQLGRSEIDLPGLDLGGAGTP
jgi:spermidine synthase